jgi:hypothetical protein
MLVLSIPGLVVEGLFAFNTLDGGGSLQLFALAVGALFGVAAYAAYVIPVLALAFLYFDLVERKEGTALGVALDRLGRTGQAVSEEAAPARPQGAAERPPVPEALPERGFRGGGFDEGDGPGRAR